MFYYEGTEEVAWRICGCSIPGSVQGQVGWGFEKPDLVGGVSAHGRGGWNCVIFKVSSVTNHFLIV